MNLLSFSDAALVMVGHGTTLTPDSAATVYQHAAEVRRLGVFNEVREAFWKEEPRVESVLAELTQARVFIAPFFISEGYFCERVIPEALGFRAAGETTWKRARRRGSQLQFYCRPVGTHPSMTRVLLAHARGILEQFPFPAVPSPAETSLFIAGHGTDKFEDSGLAVQQQVELIRAVGLYADVQPIFLEQSPRIDECFRLCRTRHLVVLPFFSSNGLHVRQDIPVLLGESESVVRRRLDRGQPSWRNPTEKHGKLVWYAPAIGTDPLMAEVILERVREAATWGIDE